MENQESVSNLQQSTKNRSSILPEADELSFEQRLYRILKAIDADVVPDYMESFGMGAEGVSAGIKFKQATETLSEDEFVIAMKQGKLPAAEFSPVELDTLFKGVSAAYDPDGETDC